MSLIKLYFIVFGILISFSMPELSIADANNSVQVRADSSSLLTFIAKYDLYRGSIKMGESSYELKRLGDNNYLLEGRAAPAGLIALFPAATAVEKSYWQFVDGKIQPQQYKYSLKAAFVKKKMTSTFDWTSLIATVIHNKVTRTVPIKKGDLDRSLVPIAVMLDLKRGTLSTKYRYADRRRIKSYSFKKISQQWLQTDLGLFDTELVETTQKSKKKNKIKRRTVFWGAKKIDFLPVRISHQSGDDSEVVMVLTSLEGELGNKLKNSK